MKPGDESFRTNLWSALAEGGWLAAVVVVAIYFNTDTFRIFEEEKVYLFRSIALLVAVALGAALFGNRGASSWRTAWRRPLVKPVAALAGAYIVSTAFSIAPRVSFWGGYDRAQGTYTWLCYLAVFFATGYFIRRRAQVERLIAVILFASLPLALYAVLQRFGLDPIAWSGEIFPRVHSMAGNAIFLGAVLAMVAPLTLASIIDRISRWQPGSRVRNGLSALACLGLFGLQLLAIVYSQSRGPFLALVAGLAIFLLGFAACTARRWTALIVAASAVAGICFVVVLNLEQSPIAWLRNVPYVGRLGQIDLGGRSSTRVRALVWDNVVELLAAYPQRLVFGFGPETLRFVFPRVRTEEISYHEHRNVVADRSHNETLDALVMAGIVGLIAELVLFGSLLFWLVRWLGLIHSSPQRNLFLCLILGGAFAGLATAIMIGQGLGFAGPLVPLGMIVGLFVYLFAASIGRFALTVQPQPNRLLLMALLAGLVCHFIEIQVGIAVVATRLYFFLYAALALVLAERRFGEVSSPIAGGWSGSLAPIVGLLLIVLTFDFYRVELDLRQQGYTLAALFAVVWLFGLVLDAAGFRESEGLVAHIIAFATTSLGVWILFLAIYLPHTATRFPSSNEAAARLEAAVSGPLQAVTVLYASVLGVILLHAITSYLREQTTARAFAGLRGGRALLYAAAFAAALTVAYETNLRPSRADILAAEGRSLEDAGALQAAALAYSRAEQEAPREARYTSQLGFVLLEQACRTAATDWEARRQLLRRAQAVLVRARRSNRANMDHTRNLAKLHRAWAMSHPEPDRARLHWKKADEIYRALMIAMPKNAGLMNEWATLDLDRGDMQGGLARLDESVRLDSEYFTTHWLRGNTLMALGAYPEALAAYDRALQLRPDRRAAMSGKTLALAAMGRVDEAIRVSLQAVERDGSDVVSRRNLIALYQQIGDSERALEQARAALPHAKGDVAIELRELIAQLEMGADGGQGPEAGSSDR